MAVSEVYYTSDWHLFHQKLADVRGFDSISDHNEAIAEKYIEKVRKHDIVFFLGDMSSGGKQSTLDSLEFMSKLPGRKMLVAGNHDPIHPMQYKECVKWAPAFYNVYEFVAPYMRRKIEGQRVLLNHFPQAMDHTDEIRHPEYRMSDWQHWRLHGHTHSDKVFFGKEIHVGLEAHDLQIVHQDDIAGLIKRVGELLTLFGENND